MRRAVVMCLGLVVALAGCQPSPPANDWSRTNLFGGMYEFEVEKPPGGPLDLTAHRTDGGAGQVDELVDYRVGSRRLRIVNGELSLDDTKRGRAQKGDKIKLTADGKLTVNGIERPAQ